MNLTHRRDFPEHLPQRRTEYCYLCGGLTVEKIVETPRGEPVMFQCTTCGGSSERVLIWDPNMIQYFNTDGHLVHEGAGMVLLNKANEILIVLRSKYPLLWTIPGGHMSPGEDPELAAVREIKEETGIILNKKEIKRIFEGDLKGDSCLGGADIHKWHLYYVFTDVKDIVLNDEGVRYKWVALTDIPNNITFPLAFFLRLNVIKKLFAQQKGDQSYA